MKKYKYITNTLLGIVLLGISSCNNDFMDRYPTDSINDENFWNSEKDLEIYCNGLYTFIKGHSGISPLLTGDNQSDNMVPQDYNVIAAGEHVVPAKSGDSDWNWTFTRKCNYFLNRYQIVPIKEEVKEAYAGEVMFFKAWDYFEKVKRYGDIPWIYKDLNVDSEELYGTRDSRIMVMDSVLYCIDWAINNYPLMKMLHLTVLIAM